MDRHGFAAPERAPFPFALFPGMGFWPVEQVALDDMVGDAVIVEQGLSSGCRIGTAERKRVEQQNGRGNANPDQLQERGGPIGVYIGRDDDQAGRMADGFLCICQQIGERTLTRACQGQGAQQIHRMPR